MSADGSVTLKSGERESRLNVQLTWGDGEYTFRLAIGQLREWQEKVNAPRVAIGAKPIGPGDAIHLLAFGGWMIDDVRETIRLGLIGGGMKPVDAHKLVVRYVDERPLAESVQPAHVIMMAAVIGVPDDPVGKNQAEETASETTTVSSSPLSTVPGEPLGTHPIRSTDVLSGSLPPQSMDSEGPTATTMSPTP